MLTTEVPMPTDLASQIMTRISMFAEHVNDKLDDWRAPSSPRAMRALEEAVAEGVRSLADDIVGDILEAQLSEPEFQATACAAAKASGRYRHNGGRNVAVTLLGGSKRRFRVPYVKPDRRGLVGRPRGSGRRGEGGSGLYPTLAALGIADGFTPALAAEICRQVTDSESVRVGRQALARRGIDLGHKQTLRIVGKVGQRTVAQREQWLHERLEQAPVDGGLLAGKRVLISTDGGRCRLRVPAKSGRRRAKTGHRGYKAPWQEPKLLVIYVLDDKGKVECSFRPVIDGTMGDCDAMFRMLLGYLKGLGAHEAAELVVVADGARWIWDRVDALATGLGIPRDRVIEVLDWYHAMETLHTIANIPAGWSESRRKRWLGQARKQLRAGRIDALAEHIGALVVGRRAKKVQAHVGYFTKNAHRMQYAAFRERHIPLGSGAMESAVRRVVNLRLKSNAKFWLAENAEAMLLLRSYSKAGRFDDLIDWSFAKAVPWWCTAPPSLIHSAPAALHEEPYDALHEAA